MQFAIKQEALLAALKAIKAPGKGRSSLPVLKHALIEARGEEVSFTTTDLSLRVSCTTTETVRVVAEGAHTAEYQQLLDTVKALPHGEELVVRQLEGSIEISCAGRKFVRGMSADEFPVWSPTRSPGERFTESRLEMIPNPSGNDGTRVTNVYTYEVLSTHRQRVRLSRELLNMILTQVVYVAADDDARPVLQSVLVELEHDRLRMVAGDAFRVVQHIEEVPGTWAQPVLLDARSFQQAAKLLPKGSEVEIEVVYTVSRLCEKNAQAVFDAPQHFHAAEARLTADTAVVYMRPTEGIYPNFTQTIPRNPTTRSKCDVAHLRSGYQAIWPVAKDAGNCTTLYLAGERLTIEAKTDEQPEPTVHEISAVTEGPDVHAILNCQYMLDFLKATTATHVVIGVTSPNRPVSVRPHMEENAGETVYVIMPMTRNR